MKLYFSPGACSLSPHIVAHEVGLPLTIDKVRNKRTSDDATSGRSTPRATCRRSSSTSGEVLTEGTAIVQYLADQKPEAGLVPPNGTLARYRLQEMLGYINSELHKSYSPLFNPKTPAESREERIEYLRRRYALIEQTLAGKDYLFGDQFTVADAYLFTVTNWAAW
jgi:glutathione S-transferase